MLRCLYIDDVHGVAFFDTIKGRFIEAGGRQHWEDLTALEECFGDRPGVVERLSQLAQAEQNRAIHGYDGPIVPSFG